MRVWTVTMDGRNERDIVSWINRAKLLSSPLIKEMENTDS